MIRFLELVQTLQMAVKSLQMYTAAHPRTQEALGTLARGLEDWLGERPSLHLAASSGKVFLDGQPVEAASIHLNTLARQLSERRISGFVFQRGVSTEELQAVLNLLILKPARVEELGGPAAILARESLPHVRLSQTQYREVSEGSEDGTGEVTPPSAAPAAPATPAEVPPGPAPDAAPPDATVLWQTWAQALAAALAEASALDPLLGAAPLVERFPGERPPTQLGHLGDLARGLGWGEAFPAPEQLEGLRSALAALPPEEQISVVAGIPTLSPAPPSLRMGFAALAPEALGAGASALAAAGTPWEDLQVVLAEILRFSSQKAAMLEGLAHAWAARGLDGSGLDQLAHRMTWEDRSLEDRLELALQEGPFWELSLDQRLAFLRRLLEAGRTDSFLALLERILDALTSEAAARRESAARTLAGVTPWLRDPGLPLEAEGPLVEGLSAHFGWEPLEQILVPTAASLAQVLDYLIHQGQMGSARGLMDDLTNLSAFLEVPAPWREAALEGLRRRLASPELLKTAVEQLQATEPERILSEFIPFFEAIGPEAATCLVDVLGTEPDRKRRARLVDVIRVLGELAIPALREGLASPRWYLVRNTLNLLADMGDASLLTPVLDCLGHADGRVRRAAVRAAWRLAGPDAEHPLLELLPQTDAETQEEILFVLAQMRSLHATPLLSALAANAKLPEKLRIRFVEVLGQIGDPKAVRGLSDLLKRKGRMFFTHVEPQDLRLAAARALAAISDPGALAALQQVVGEEPRGEARTALERILALRIAQP